MTFQKMMEAGRKRKEAIKEALMVKLNETKRGKAIIRQAELNYKEAVHYATLRYRREVNANKRGK
jgi:predicted transcriptional regulator